MNKLLRYLIFALLIIGVGYAVYYYMNKPAEIVVKQNIEGVVSENQKVALDGESQFDASDDQSFAQAEGEESAEEISEDKEMVSEEIDEVVSEEKKEEEVNKDFKPAKR